MLFDENGMFRLDEEIAKQPTFQKIMEDGMVTDEEVKAQSDKIVSMLKDMEARYTEPQLFEIKRLLAETSVRCAVGCCGE